ncbi:MAG TPA: hypothetical protein PKC03_18075 [Dokdonella sp.]|nr:hypothetical protein [Dokdonella sp.]
MSDSNLFTVVRNRLPPAEHKSPTALLAAGLLFHLGMSSAVALAQTPAIVELQYSADIGANLLDASHFVRRSDYVIDNTLGRRARVLIAGLPDTANLRDFQIDSSHIALFALDSGFSASGTYFDPADVIASNDGVFIKAFDAAAAGVPKGVRCDGVARANGNGALLLSFDTAFKVGGVSIFPADVIAVNGNSFGAKVLDARALGIPANLDIDAIDAMGTNSDLLVSFDTAGVVGGIAFTSSDVMQLHLADASWSKRFALRTFSDRWNTANLDGLGTAPVSDFLFDNSFD